MAFIDDPIVVVEVGDRGVHARAWNELRHACTSILFEPDVARSAGSSGGSRRPNARVVSSTLGARDGDATMYLTGEPAGRSLYRPAPTLGQRYPAIRSAELLGERQVRVETLDGWCQREGIGAIDVLDIADGGSELDLLRGAEQTLRTVRAVRVSVQFDEVHEGAPLFGEIDRYLRDRDFVLWRLGQLGHFVPSDGLDAVTGSEVVVYDDRAIPHPVHAGQLLTGEALYVGSALASPDGAVDWKAAVRDAACAAGIGLMDVAGTQVRKAATAAGPKLGPVLAGIAADPHEPSTRFAEQFALAPEAVLARQAAPLRHSYVLTMDQQFEGGGWRAPEQHAVGPLRWTGPGRDAWIDLPLSLAPGTRVELVVAAAMVPELVTGLELEVNRTPLALTVTPSDEMLRVAGVVPSDYDAPRPFTRLLIRVPYTVPWQQLHPGTDIGLEIGVAISTVLLTPPGGQPT